MTSSRIVTALRTSPMFAALSDDALSQLAERARMRSYKPQQLVFEYDAEGDSLAVVVTGRVKITIRSLGGGELVLTWIGPGETLGELSILDGGRRSADAEALEDTTVVLIDRGAVQRAMREEPRLAENVWRNVGASMRRLTEAAADLVFLDIPRRVAKFLIEQHERRQSEGVPISQEELAHHVGGTRQSVNLALRGFEKRGWVELRSRRVVVRDRAALVRFAGR